MPKMMTVKEVSERLSISIPTTYRLLQTGELVGRRVGVGRGRLLIDPADVDRYWEVAKDRVVQVKAEPAPEVEVFRHSRMPKSKPVNTVNKSPRKPKVPIEPELEDQVFRHSKRPSLTQANPANKPSRKPMPPIEPELMMPPLSHLKLPASSPKQE